LINQTPRLQELWLTFPAIKIAFFPVPKNGSISPL